MIGKLALFFRHPCISSGLEQCFHVHGKIGKDLQYIVAPPPLRGRGAIFSFLIGTLRLSNLSPAFLRCLVYVYHTEDPVATSTALSSRGVFTRGLPLPLRAGTTLASRDALLSEADDRLSVTVVVSRSVLSTMGCSHFVMLVLRVQLRRDMYLSLGAYIAIAEAVLSMHNSLINVRFVPKKRVHHCPTRNEL